jgi:hypothetical protein
MCFPFVKRIRLVIRQVRRPACLPHRLIVAAMIITDFAELRVLIGPLKKLLATVAMLRHFCPLSAR